jgi:hypothetical protein
MATRASVLAVAATAASAFCTWASPAPYCALRLAAVRDRPERRACCTSSILRTVCAALVSAEERAEANSLRICDVFEAVSDVFVPGVVLCVVLSIRIILVPARRGKRWRE